MATTADSTAFSTAVAAVRVGTSPDEAAEELLERLSLEERLGLLDGDLPFWQGLAEMMAEGYNRTPVPMGRIERLGIPGLLFSDGPRGVVVGASTAFPVSMARGATWDVELKERVGVAIGLEVRAQGGNFFGGVCINLPRHPAWGRSHRDGHPAAFPLGYGLSDTTFTLTELAVGAPDGGAFTATVTVTNTGSRAGRHVVQFYGLPIGAGEDFPTRVLLGFAAVDLAAGASASISVAASPRPLQRWMSDGFVPASPTAVIEAASYAGDPGAITAASELELT
ncbi:fibronectin type III-like domain-contianing protein [Streptomyces sp. CA-210063]|uniref:fibronectin type III-like domain-contianing protein n=1 Tax=Streptomyces sp. CA-210063 TaxID=2801029 RepID=UPI00214BABF5|nr:fibronectin type III-like domain-contianing protein [Streptomyces sp. CA-210063]UUU28473.1 fibronectin type III-like domain-contianing protein [Streptomyces sp. CA-210063]